MKLPMSYLDAAVGESAPGAASPRLIDLPILASTQFCMEILLRGDVLDLRSLIEVVAFDPCLMLRLSLLAAQDQTRPWRSVDELIISLGSAGLRAALYVTPSTWHQQAQLQRFAEHAVTIAQHSSIAAAALSLCEQQAFVLGLFHEIGYLCSAVGWTDAPEEKTEAAFLADCVAEAFFLPPDLKAALHAVHLQDETQPWVLLVHAAHELAEPLRGSRKLSSGSHFHEKTALPVWPADCIVQE